MTLSSLALTALVTLLALAVYGWNIVAVGRARGIHKVPAPQMDGPPAFQRAVRVQANMVEQLILFLPLLWLAAAFGAPVMAAGLGIVWIVGRVMYALGYYQQAEKRHSGFGIAMLAAAGLFILALVGIIRMMVAG